MFLKLQMQTYALFNSKKSMTQRLINEEQSAVTMLIILPNKEFLTLSISSQA